MSTLSFGRLVPSLSATEVPSVVGNGIKNLGCLVSRVYWSGLKALASIPVFVTGVFLEGLFAKGTWSYAFTNGKIIPIFTPSGQPSIGAPIIQKAGALWGENPWIALLGIVAIVTTIAAIIYMNDN